MLGALLGAASTESSTTTSILAIDLYISVLAALVFGFVIACVYTYRARYTKSFVVSLALLPAIVAVVILLVNGNVGTGVAVAGAFSLVRFRSVAGTAKDIAFIFLAMVIGLAAGIGYEIDAAVLTVVFSVVWLVYTRLNFGEPRLMRERTLRIAVPENLDYTTLFDEVFERFVSDARLVEVRTANMGSLYKLVYQLVLNDVREERALLDALRVRNGNLEVALSYQEVARDEL